MSSIDVGETVKFRVTWRDEAGALLDPDSQEWRVYDSDNVLQHSFTESDLTQDSPGVYSVYYDIPDGVGRQVWTVFCKAVKQNRTGIVSKEFSVFMR